MPTPFSLRSFDPGKDRAFLECRSGEFICLVKARGEKRKLPTSLGYNMTSYDPEKKGFSG